MAAPAVARSYGPPLCPSFAEVCSFLERYGAALDLPEMTFPQMERYLRDTTAVPKPLVELHVKLLRKLGRSVTTDRWEKYLAKVCQELNSTWAWELEQKGYQEMSMECKSSILKYLCECQFDDNLKFKMVVNEEDPEKMRLQPLGRDQQGLMYWFQLDQEQNIRLYTEEQDDLDGSTWKCIVRTRNDLAEALELLKAQIESNQCQDQDQTQNQAGCRSTSPAEKDTANEDFKNTKLLKTSAEQNDKKKTGPAMEKKPIKQDIKEEENAESKMENMDRKLAAFDNRVSTITAIKSEHRDADGPKNAVSVLMSPSVSLIKMNREDEAEQAAVRCNQQAKIPLKKRDLKLAGCFHTNHLNNTNSSSIIVCNPSVINAKDCRGRDGKLQNSLAPQGSPGSSLQQQPAVSASRQELTNGRASHLPPREGHNGVIGQVGVVSHVGVIRSPSELHRAPGAEHREENGPKSEPCGLRAAEGGKEVSRQSVVVRKGQPDQETTQTASLLSTHAILSLKPEVIVRKVDSLSFSSLTTTETGRQMEKDQNTKTTERTTEDNSSQQEEGGPEESREETQGAVKEEPGTNSGTSGKADSESGGAVSPQNADRLNKKDQQGQGVNGGLVSVVKLKKIGFVTEQKRGPLEEASSELQKEGIRLKIKIPPHRRNKLRRKEGKEEIKNREQEVQKEARALRRSARICRSSALPNCRPSSKVAESQKKKPQKKETPPVKTREEEEADEEEDDDDDEGQSSPSAKNQKHEPAGKFNKRKGKRRHGRPRWTNVRPKRHKPNEEGEVEDRGRKRGEQEEKGGSASEEDLCKSEEIPAEDACTHCGLPNHPELILLCDLCDRGYHTACLRPPLMLIPDGEWFCPPCQHKMLCEKLEEQLQNLDSALKKKERAERRRERLVYVGISVENIIPEGDGEEGEEEKSAKKKDPKKTKNLGRRSTRTRKHISYRFDDFDDAIDEAIEEDVRDIGSGAETGKETAAVLSEAVKGNQRPIRTQTRAARNKKKRRLNDLESDSTAIESEEEFMLSNSSEEEEFGASGADDGEDEDAGSDGGSLDAGARPKRGLRGAPKYKPRTIQRRGRKRRRRRSSEEEEESDVEMDSDQFSDMTDSDADKKRRGLRRGQRQQVNYRETSESSDNSRTSAKREQVKRRGRPRKERFSSDYSDVSASSKDSEDDYDEEEEDGRRRVNRRRRRGEEEELRSSRTREKRKRYENEDGRRRLKRRQLGKADDEDDDGRRSSSARTDRDKEDPERMGRGKRREMLSQQRRKLLAQMLKKRRPSTEDEDESESDDSQSSSGDDRPIRKRLNRIDSDDEEDEKYINSDDEADEDKGQKAMGKKSKQRDDDKTRGGAQEKGRGRSPSPSNGLQTSRDAPKPRAGSPSERREGAASGRRERHNGPVHPAAEEEEEEGQSDSLNSVQNSPQS